MQTKAYCTETMQMDWKDQHQVGKDNHHLFDIQRSMNLPETYTFGDTVDTIFVSLLESLKEIHAYNIVHRDCECTTVSFTFSC